MRTKVAIALWMVANFCLLPLGMNKSQAQPGTCVGGQSASIIGGCANTDQDAGTCNLQCDSNPVGACFPDNWRGCQNTTTPVVAAENTNLTKYGSCFSFGGTSYACVYCNGSPPQFICGTGNEYSVAGCPNDKVLCSYNWILTGAFCKCKNQ